jgi:predicted HAD superfamily Cof-like phosphohydrolase
MPTLHVVQTVVEGISYDLSPNSIKASIHYNKSNGNEKKSIEFSVAGAYYNQRFRTQSSRTRSQMALQAKGNINSTQKFYFFLIKPTDALISQMYFCRENLHVLGSSSAHHQEFSTVHSALVYVMQV